MGVLRSQINGPAAAGFFVAAQFRFCGFFCFAELCLAEFLQSSKLSLSMRHKERLIKTYGDNKETEMARYAKKMLTIDALEHELDRLIDNNKCFGSISEDLRKLVHQVFFVHAILEGQLGMRILYRLFEEQLKSFQGQGYYLTEMTGELIRKLTYTEKLAMIREFKDGAPCGTLEKINTIRNDFGHPLSRGWGDKYSSKASKVEVLQLLIVGIKGTEEYMEKVRRESGI